MLAACSLPLYGHADKGTEVEDPTLVSRIVSEAKVLHPLVSHVFGTHVEEMYTASVPVEKDPWDAPPWVGPERQKERRTQLGLDDPTSKRFTDSCQFVSLGSFCGVAFALQGLGLKTHAYPFDWLRTPVEGILHCMRTNFADFCTYTFSRPEANGAVLYGNSNWGGSFWHHDPSDPDVQQAFRRRADRLMGRCVDPADSAPRVFVRHANSSSELEASLALQAALRQLWPRSEVYLLVIVDMQRWQGALCLRGVDKLLFYHVDQGLFADPGKQFALQMELNVEAYAQAIASALRFWAGDRETMSKTLLVRSIGDLVALTQPFHGGDPASSIFVPTRI